MSQQIPATAEAPAAPSIHVWMTVEEAAGALGTPEPLLICQIEVGELESRLSEAGTVEVLVALPPRTPGVRSTEKVGVSIVAGSEPSPGDMSLGAQTIPMLAGSLLPMLQSVRQAQREELHGVRRSARLAWTAAAIMLLAASFGATIGLRAITLSRQQVSDLTQQIQRSGADATTVAAERDALRSRLGEAREAAAKIEGQLAVERQVEDTLFKAALASHNQKKAEPNAPAFANGAD